MSQIIIQNPSNLCKVNNINMIRCEILAVVICEGEIDCEYKVYSVYKDKQIVLQE